MAKAKKKRRPHVDVDLLREDGQLTPIRFDYTSLLKLEDLIAPEESDIFDGVKAGIHDLMRAGRHRKLRCALLCAGMTNHRMTMDATASLLERFLNRADDPDEALKKLDLKLGEALKISSHVDFPYNPFDMADWQRYADEQEEKAAKQEGQAEVHPDDGAETAEQEEGDEARPPAE